MYHELLTWNKLVGVVICLVGLVFLILKNIYKNIRSFSILRMF